MASLSNSRRSHSTFYLLPSGAIDAKNGLWAAVEDGNKVVLSFTWPSVLLSPKILMRSILACCSEIDVGQGALLMQGIMDYLERFQKNKEILLSRLAASDQALVKNSLDKIYPFNINQDNLIHSN